MTKSTFNRYVPAVRLQQTGFWSLRLLLNTISYIFAGIGEPLIGRAIDSTGQTSIIFPIVAGLCAASTVMSMLIGR